MFSSPLYTFAQVCPCDKSACFQFEIRDDNIFKLKGAIKKSASLLSYSVVNTAHWNQR